jgi:hypothetical protein
MRYRLVVALFVAGTTAACGGHSASPASTAAPVPESGNRYTQQVDGYLARLASNARGQGYQRLAAGPVYGSLHDDETASHTMEVVGGNNYALMGACDNDCTDVDLKIYDEKGVLLMQDIAVDDTPVLTFQAAASGRYRVQVIMATCNRNPCFYGIQLMAR